MQSYRLEASDGHGHWHVLSSGFNAQQSSWSAASGATGATIGLRHLDDAAGANAVRFTLLRSASAAAANITMMAFAV